MRFCISDRETVKLIVSPTAPPVGLTMSSVSQRTTEMKDGKSKKKSSRAVFRQNADCHELIGPKVKMIPFYVPHV